MPTLGIGAIVESKGFGRKTLLNFSPPTAASFKKAKDFDGKDYWGAMGVTPKRVNSNWTRGSSIGIVEGRISGLRSPFSHRL